MLAQANLDPFEQQGVQCNVMTEQRDRAMTRPYQLEVQALQQLQLPFKQWQHLLPPMDESADSAQIMYIVGTRASSHHILASVPYSVFSLQCSAEV